MIVNLTKSYVHQGKIYAAGNGVEIPDDLAAKLGLVGDKAPANNKPEPPKV